MADPDFSSSRAGSALFGVHAEALALRQERLRLIASNLANADTPHYLARDIDFPAALRTATEKAAEIAAAPGGGTGVTRAIADEGVIADEVAAAHRVYRLPDQASLDGNTVDASGEHAAFARASLEYRASLGFVEDRVRALTTAITGQ